MDRTSSQNHPSPGPSLPVRSTRLAAGRRSPILGAVLMILAAAPAGAHPPEESSRTDLVPAEKNWSFRVTPYFWLTGFKVTINSVEIRRDVDQMAAVLQGIFLVKAKVQYRRYLFGLDGFYADLGQGNGLGPIALELQFKQKFLTPRFGWMVLDKVDRARHSGAELWVTLGGRYLEFESISRFAYQPILGGEPQADEGGFQDHWWDPLLGAFARFPVTYGVQFQVSGDIGGFGIGRASKFTWDLGALAAFRIADFAAITAGYQIMAYNRDSGDDPGAVNTMLYMSGFTLGVSFFH